MPVGGKPKLDDIKKTAKTDFESLDKLYLSKRDKLEPKAQLEPKEEPEANGDLLGGAR